MIVTSLWKPHNLGRCFPPSTAMLGYRKRLIAKRMFLISPRHQMSRGQSSATDGKEKGLSCSSQTRLGLPVGNCPTSLHINQYSTSLNLLAVSHFVGSLHVVLVLIFNKCISAWLTCSSIMTAEPMKRTRTGKTEHRRM